MHKTGLLAAKASIYVGGWYPERDHCFHYLRHDGPEHILAFAPTQSGKGVGLVIPTLLAWPEGAVVYGHQGRELGQDRQDSEASWGHVCFKFSPVEEKASSSFNPWSEVGSSRCGNVSDAQNIPT